VSSRFARGRVRLLVALSAAATAVAMGAPAGAHANYYIQWTCGRIAPNTWCLPSDKSHTWDRNAVSHGQGPNYSYAIYMCEKLVAPNTYPEYQYSRRCAYSSHFSGFSDDNGRAPYPNTNTTMWPLVANGNNSFYATIYGAADAG
jgi:hypothetical protein